MEPWIAGPLAGLFATAVMTILEVPAWRRRGFAGILDPAAGAAFGIALWALTLAVHARVTGRRIRGDSVRMAAAMVSLGSHLVYGIALGVLVLLL